MVESLSEGTNTIPPSEERAGGRAWRRARTLLFLGEMTHYFIVVSLESRPQSIILNNFVKFLTSHRKIVSSSVQKINPCTVKLSQFDSRMLLHFICLTTYLFIIDSIKYMCGIYRTKFRPIRNDVSSCWSQYNSIIQLSLSLKKLFHCKTLDCDFLKHRLSGDTECEKTITVGEYYCR